jgi:flagellar biosynthetic protein FliQ
MNEADTLEIAREAILVMLQVAGPMMLLSLVVGIAISLFQAMTQLQEQTLTFAPKIIIMSVALFVLLPFMLSSITNFTERLMDRIVSLG